jgi:hypothetical protein
MARIAPCFGRRETRLTWMLYGYLEIRSFAATAR